ncbi:hypothetical protein REPUB_Repub19eG0134000 [Reevesia pubescens]
MKMGKDAPKVVEMMFQEGGESYAEGNGKDVSVSCLDLLEVDCFGGNATNERTWLDNKRVWELAYGRIALDLVNENQGRRL